MDITKKDIYAIVLMNDQTHTLCDGTTFVDEKGAIIFEQYVEDADLRGAREKAQQLSKTYGKAMIAKLVFLKE